MITACYNGQFRRYYFSQQFTRVIIPNAPTVCDRLYTVHCLQGGTLYTWPFSPEPTFFLFDNCLLYCLLYWAISAELLKSTVYPNDHTNRDYCLRQTLHCSLFASWNTMYLAIFTRAIILFYLITVCCSVCCTGRFRHKCFSQLQQY